MIKGQKIELIPAVLSDRDDVYEWCFESETTKSHSGPPDFPNAKIATREEFHAEDYEEYFYDGSRLEDGRGYIIVHDGERIGFISYCCFHLKAGIAEIDIWMNSERHCGQGFGTDAIVSLAEHLRETMGMRELIIRPSARNVRAVRAYGKAGFVQTERAVEEFYKDEYLELYGEGDYEGGESTLLVKELAK